MTPASTRLREIITTLPDDVQADALTALAEIETEILEAVTTPTKRRRDDALRRLYTHYRGPSEDAAVSAMLAAAEEYRSGRWRRSDQYMTIPPSSDAATSLMWEVLKLSNSAFPSRNTVKTAIRSA